MLGVTLQAHWLRACLLLVSYFSRCFADEGPLLRSSEYNDGAYGKYVTETFQTINATAPRLNIVKPFTNCDDGSLIFIAPRGEIANSSLCIFDASGHLVWTYDQYYGQAYNLQVQQYNGEKYLTYWAGDNSVGGHGVGNYYMVRMNRTGRPLLTDLSSAGPALPAV